MYKKIITSVFFFILLISIVEVALAQTRVGVSVHDEFTYSVIVFWKAGDNSGLSDLYETNATEYFKIEITQVQNSIVYMDGTYHLYTGTEEYISDNVNVGALHCNSWLFPANLVKGDVFHDNLGQNYLVSDTVTRIYQSTQREANYIIEDLTSQHLDLYVDKSTGVLLEAESTFFNNPNMNGTLSLMIEQANTLGIAENPTQSNGPSKILTPAPTLTPTQATTPLPSVPEFPAWSILPVALVTVAAAIMVRGKRKP
jgi:hypothetical protein